MKLIKKSILILFGVFIYISPIVAQTNNNSSPTDFGTTGETAINPNDAQTIPINKCIVLLFILGMSYAFIIFSNFRKIKPELITHRIFKNNKPITSINRLK